MRVLRQRAAFTLIELLMVVAIIAVVAAVTVPTFVKSIRGQRLRAAARTVVMAGRYARSMALLTQQELTVAFDITGGKVSILRAGGRSASGGNTASNGIGAAGGAVLAEPEPGGPVASDSNAPAPGGGPADIVRALEGIRIEYVEIEGAERRTEGGAQVVYASNGRCTPYRVGLVDGEGGAVTIEVDPLASARTEGFRK